ncbi:MAG TPA: acid phosphatase [Burkholderiales bacterium]
MNLRRLLLLLFIVGIASCATRTGDDGLSKIEHIVVIYGENRSFDNLYGLFPGADGIAQATAEQKTQVDRDGRPLPHLPPVWSRGKPDPAFPSALPNGPFRIDAPPIDLPLTVRTRDLVHLFHVHKEQIAGGKNNRFAALSDAGGLTMGYYDGSQMAMWKLAQEFVLADHFFQAAYGGSFINHQWLVCACTPYDPAAPQQMRTQLDERGNVKWRDNIPSALAGPLWFLEGIYTPDGYAVNSAQPPYQPGAIGPAPGGDKRYADPRYHPLPPQTAKTIGDTLSAKGISWAWYAGGWKAAIADGERDAKEKRSVIYTGEIAFQPHHQPFNYFERFAPGTRDREQHLKDLDDLLKDLDNGTLPQVAFYKPAGRLNQHPGYADVAAGDVHIHALVERLRKSPQWSKMAVIVTYDENGGFWDHVPPPSGPGWSDRWGPGSRIPAIIISPYAKRGHVDKTPYDTTSVIKFITKRFALEPLPGVRANAGDLTNAFQF